MIEFIEQEEKHLNAVRRFNARLVAGNAVTPFLMGETHTPPVGGLVKSRFMVGVEEEEVRGGYLEVTYPSVLGEAINCQSPLSEGLVDQKYLMLPSQMFKVLTRTNPYVFVVGMGGLRNPLPRFLMAAGWSVEEVPFYYKVIRASRFLTQIPVLRRTPWERAAARIAAYSGAGVVAFHVMHRGSGVPDLRRWSIEKGEWGSWLTPLWERFRQPLRFAVTRDEHTLPLLFRGKREIGPLLVKRDGQVRGWSMALLTQMTNSGHFGNLRVATILDCIADEEDQIAAIAHTTKYLAAQGADIVITNQSYTPQRKAFQSAGFRQGPSNYVLAASPKLSAAVGGKPVESGQIYVTRADGDGRINL